MSERREPVGKAIVGSIAAALGQVVDLAAAGRADDGESEAVHEVRTCFKKARAALRLVRDDLGEEVYRQENLCFRDAARPLTEVRDAEVLVETWDDLRGSFPDLLDQEGMAGVREALIAHRREVARRVLVEGRALTIVEAIAAVALFRVAGWKLDEKAWQSARRGLLRVYRRGRRALSRAAETRADADLHEWRKQAKYLWAEHKILARAWPALGKKRAKRLHELWSLLGDDHDLAVLRQRLAVLLADDVGAKAFEAIETRRGELQESAFELGRRLYAKRPRAFLRRLASAGTTSPSISRNPATAPSTARTALAIMTARKAAM
jgi:CHAD domain-containing protein